MTISPTNRGLVLDVNCLFKQLPPENRFTVVVKSRAIEDDVGFEVVTSDLGDSFEHLTVTKNTNNSKNLNLMRFLLVQLELMMETLLSISLLLKIPILQKNLNLMRFLLVQLELMMETLDMRLC